ncbi:MAG TPA: hypothetical protein VHL59_11415 [Thermoanaerobaculia bacterium]|nr:hypothetical protein [Thermoanaerobaculia bacterium]
MFPKKIIWFAIVMSTFVYALMLYVLSQDWPPAGSFDEAVRKPMVLPLYMVAMVSFLMAFLLPRAFRDPRQAWIASLALFESCAVFGLVVAFLNQDWRLFLPGWALSLLGFLIRFPSESSPADRG